jgi:hypothetical protein
MKHVFYDTGDLHFNVFKEKYNSMEINNEPFK